MAYKFAVMSIDDSRHEKKKAIREKFGFLEELWFQSVDGTDLETVDQWLANHPWIDFPIYEGQTHGWTCKRGELGAWLTTINMWEELLFDKVDGLIAFEDDAELTDDAANKISYYIQKARMQHSEFDLISLYIPPDQKEDYYHFVGIDPADGKPDIHHRTHVPGGADMWKIDDNFSYSYQNYSNVALFYTKSGAYKFLCEVAKRGIDMPVDCFVHQISNLDHFVKYAPHPEAPRFVETDWDAPTTIHHTEVIDAYRVYGSGT